MAGIRRLCVYCGSSAGADPRHREAAGALGGALAGAGIGLVYGGGSRGLMGVVADAVLAAGGNVTGIIPAPLREAELAHRGLTELVVVANMHQRKLAMAERADAFAALPGGLGTLDEMLEIITWRQLGLHAKPIFLIDIAGYWQPLLDLFAHIAASGFAEPPVPRLVRVMPGIEALIAALAPPAPPPHHPNGRP